MTRTDKIKLEGESHKEWQVIKLETDNPIQDHPNWTIKIIATLTEKTKKGDEQKQQTKKDTQLTFPQTIHII